MLINELGFARLTEPRARPLHPNEPVPKGRRKVRLPRAWRGKEAELHRQLDALAIPALQRGLAASIVSSERDELDLMIKFAKQLKCRLKPSSEQSGSAPAQDAA